MSFWVPRASKMDTTSDLADIAKTNENCLFLFFVLEGWRRANAVTGSLEELLAELLGGWMADGWLADGLVAAGWFAGRPQGHQDPEDMVRRW